MEQVSDAEESKLNMTTNKYINDAKDLYTKINELRKDPIKFANKLTLTMTYINKRDYTLREPNKQIITLKEGIHSYEEAVTFLKLTNKIEELIYDEQLSKIAQDHANDLGSKGIIGNDSTDGKRKFEDRFKRFGTFTQIEEIILISDSSDFNRILSNLIVCDGDEKRINRNLILSTTLNQIGLGIAEFNKKNFVVVIDFASEFKLRNTKSLNKNDDSQNKLSKLNEFSLDLDNNRDKIVETITLTAAFEDEIMKFDKELDNEIMIDDYLEKKEVKQILVEKNRLKLIKNITFVYADGNVRKMILSKTWTPK